MEENILRGIKACYHEINGKNEFTVNPGTVIYLLSGKKHRFVVENNSHILGEKQPTQSLRSPIQSGRLFYLGFGKKPKTPKKMKTYHFGQI